jgi:hypothetical protein
MKFLVYDEKTHVYYFKAAKSPVKHNFVAYRRKINNALSIFGAE